MRAATTAASRSACPACHKSPGIGPGSPSMSTNVPAAVVKSAGCISSTYTPRLISLLIVGPSPARRSAHTAVTVPAYLPRNLRTPSINQLVPGRLSTSTPSPPPGRMPATAIVDERRSTLEANAITYGPASSSRLVDWRAQMSGSILVSSAPLGRIPSMVRANITRSCASRRTALSVSE